MVEDNSIINLGFIINKPKVPIITAKINIFMLFDNLIFFNLSSNLNFKKINCKNNNKKIITAAPGPETPLIIPMMLLDFNWRELSK